MHAFIKRSLERRVGLFLAFASLRVASSQISPTSSLTLQITDPRPLAAAVLKVEQLSGLAVNYEDVPYLFSGDVQDITDQITTPTQKAQGIAGVRVLVPRGGMLSVPILVSSSTRLLADAPSVLNALNAILAVHNASVSSPGQFRLTNNNGVFYVEPTIGHSTTGTSVQVTPVLSTQVTIPLQQINGIEALKLILDQVSKATGVPRIKLGSIPAFTFIRDKIKFSATAEPANQVLSRLFASLYSEGSAAPVDSQTMSYRLLYEPKEQDYAINIHPVMNPNSKQTASNPQPKPTSGPGRFYNPSQK
jgi:hypothetical protein